MDPLPPIPIPTSQRWKEFRLRGLPLLVFAFGLVVAAKVWKQNVSTAFLVGEAEVVQANVTSIQAGILSQLQVSMFDEVAKDQVLGHVVTTPPRVVEASLAVIRAELEVIRTTMLPLLDQQRNSLSWEQLNLDLMNHRIALANARIGLQFAESQFERNARLYQDRLVSDDVLDESKMNRDKLRMELEEQTRIIAELEPALTRLKEAGRLAANENPQDSIRASIAVEEEKLKLTEAQLNPIPLTAPIAGRVSVLLRRSGETLAAGETVLTIVSERSERITAFLRQPVMLEPRKGMAVEIITRSAKRERAAASIQQVGVRWQPISQALLRNGATFENGLPILVDVPSHMRLRPGELVDLSIQDVAPVSGN